MAYVRRSHARQPYLCQKNLDLVPNPYAAPKGCRKRNCKEDSSASMSQSRLIMQNNMRTDSVTTKHVQAGKAPEPKKVCIHGKNDTLKESAPTAISGSTSYIEVISDDESENSSEWLEKFLHAELDTLHTIKSGPELVEGFAPVDCEAGLSLDEFFSNQQNPSCAASRAEEALASLNKPPPNQQNVSRAAPTAEALVTLQHRQSSSRHQSSSVAAKLDVLALPEIRQTRSYRKPPPTAPEVKAPPPCEVLNDTSRIRSNCNCSQKQLEMLQGLKEDFTAFARQQTTCMKILTNVLLRMVHKDERGNNNPGPHTRNENLTDLTL